MKDHLQFFVTEYLRELRLKITSAAQIQKLQNSNIRMRRASNISHRYYFNQILHLIIRSISLSQQLLYHRTGCMLPLHCRQLGSRHDLVYPSFIVVSNATKKNATFRCKAFHVCEAQSHSNLFLFCSQLPEGGPSRLHFVMLQHVGNDVTRRIVKHICSCSTLMRSHSSVFLHQTLHTCYTAVCYCCCEISSVNASLPRENLEQHSDTLMASEPLMSCNWGWNSTAVVLLSQINESPRVISPETMFLHGSSFSLELVLLNVAFRTTCDTALLVRKIE